MMQLIQLARCAEYVRVTRIRVTLLETFNLKLIATERLQGDFLARIYRVPYAVYGIRYPIEVAAIVGKLCRRIREVLGGLLAGGLSAATSKSAASRPTDTCRAQSAE